MMLLEMNESDTKYWFKTDNGLKRWIIIGLVFDIFPPGMNVVLGILFWLH